MTAQQNTKTKEKRKTEASTDHKKTARQTAGGRVAASGAKGNKALKELEARCEALEKEARENYERYVRVSAEFDNYKKRAARETADFKKYANESLVKELLPVVDNLERALQACTTDDEANRQVIEGVEMTLREILKVLEKFVVKPIDSLGKPFDPSYHQAVMQREHSDKPENTVVEELQRGYTMHDRLLRPAMVVVSKPGADQGNPAGERA
jgi:molecular chaperone GrpE